MLLAGPVMTVLITFSAPPRQHTPDGPTAQQSNVHQRRLEGVPPHIARQMDADYLRHHSNGSHFSRYQLYRFNRAGEEVEVALDFGEITELTVSGT